MSQSARKKGDGASPGEATNGDSLQKPECFVMMPISNPDGYAPAHFEHVYEDIFKPACEQAGFRAVRADKVEQTHLIHEDMLRRILESPMALCDLSTRNPNVLFELGLRQAFDKPVVIVQEVDTRQIFDIAGLRYTEYRQTLRYREVLEDQGTIARAIRATQDAYNRGEGINSIVRLLSLTRPATLPEVKEASQDPLLQIIRAELSAIRSEFRAALERRDDTPLSATTASRWATETRSIGIQDIEGFMETRGVQGERLDRFMLEAKEIVEQGLRGGKIPHTIVRRLSIALDLPVIVAERLYVRILVDHPGLRTLLASTSTTEVADAGQADE